jgi:hypothetical protein
MTRSHALSENKCAQWIEVWSFATVASQGVGPGGGTKALLSPVQMRDAEAWAL